MSYTKADMQAMFRKGVIFGLSCVPEPGQDTFDAADEIVSGFFNTALK